MSEQSPSPLRAARQKAGLSLDALSAKSGIAKGTLHLAETDPSKLSDRTAAAVAAALGIDPKLLRPKMSLPAIDVSHAVPWIRDIAKKLPSDHQGRALLLEALAAYTKIAASTGVLGAAADPEDPAQVGKLMAMVLASPRRALASGAFLATTEPGKRRYILLEAGGGDLAILLEIEWRLARENVELEIYARPPEAIQ